MSTFDVSAIRSQFPALQQQIDGRAPVYLDNPGGTQVPQAVIDAMTRYLIEANSNTHGPFHTSQLTDETIDGARAAMADMLNTVPEQIVFGPNMTTLTFNLSRAIGATLSAGDEVVVTKMDHDANISPWLLMARDAGASVRWVDFDPESGRLDMDSMAAAITPKTKVVACVYASNALGTVNDVARVAEMAKAVGAYSFIDAVQYAPHGPVDVQALGCDFLACSAYKFFGPHAGILYGRADLLNSLPAYKVRPASDKAPDRWETGTKNHEGLAGITAAVDYLAWVGDQFGADHNADGLNGRRGSIRRGMKAIAAYERMLSAHLIDGLQAIPNITVAGITEHDAITDRVPTAICDVAGHDPADVSRRLGEQGFYLWAGHYYAIAVMERLGRTGPGMVRIGPVHYNTVEELDRLLAALEAL